MIVNNQVDYIVTFHLSTSKLLKMGYIYEGEINYMTDYFDLLEAGVKFKKMDLWMGAYVV